MSAVSVARRVFVAAIFVVAAVATTSASAAPVEPLVSAQWLKDHLRDVGSDGAHDVGSDAVNELLQFDLL